jgi:glycosyltransferase involved in cell wall biosynthesis
MVNRVGKLNDKSTYKPLEDWQISYVPHGINPEVYKPLDSINDDVYNFVNGNKKYDFILYYNNRNIRRKQPSDVILSYKLFCDRLSKEKAEKCLLLMHTHPIDENGTNLPVVVDTLCYDYDVMFDNRILEQNIINEFYNLADCTINIANNEGFGLGTAESIMAGTPIIVNVTGGLQDQCGFEYSPNDYIKIGSLHDRKNLKDTPKHGEWVVPVWPSAINVNGSIPTPYIFEDRVNNHEVADAIMKIYNWTKEERKTKGKEGREWAKKNLSNKIMCDSLTDGIENTINNFKPKERFNLYKII